MTTAIYDGRCVLCRQTRRMVTALDWLRRIEFLDIHDWESVHARYPALSYADAMGEIHVVGRHGEMLGGFWAMRRMLRDLPLGFPLWIILLLPGMNWLGPKVYGFVARHRYAINRFFGVELEDCGNGACKIPN